MKLTRYLLLLTMLLLASGLPNADASPLTFKSPTDSVRVIFGDFDRWVPFNNTKNPDTSHLDMQHDLILISATDSLFIPRSETPVEVQFILPSMVHTEVFLFTPSVATSKTALLHAYPRFSEDSISVTLSPVYYRAADSILSELRTRYQLDSVAGNGSTSSRAINLLRWAHGAIRHDGSKENATGNALERFEKCIEGGATLNCGGLARALADVYAAVGYTSRTVVGLPYDTSDFECHQFTELWSDEDNKWLFMDPTNFAYFTNPLGGINQISEIRAELALGDSTRRDEFIRINDDINWNGQTLDKNNYLQYMAKNLFRFRTWAKPVADSTAIWTIELMPEGYVAFPMGISQQDDETVFRTHDISLFWMPPNFKRGNK
jgi:hypothetical protein